MTFLIGLILVVITGVFLAYPWFGLKTETRASRNARRRSLDRKVEAEVQQLRQASRRKGRVCPDCGTQCPESGRFCQQCGKELS